MIAALVFLTACTGGPTTEFKGTGPMHEYFPYDGDRHATYYYAGVSASDTGQAGVGYNLVVDKIEPVETVDGVEVVTFQYTRDDDGSLIGQIKWASDGDGIRIYAYAEGTGDFTTFDTPVQLTSELDYMHVGDTVETTTNGTTWTATYVGQEDIHVQWGLDWEGAVHLNLDDGDGDPDAGPFFAGDYWNVTRYGPGWMKLTGYDDKWDLADYDFCADGATCR